MPFHLQASNRWIVVESRQITWRWQVVDTLSAYHPKLSGAQQASGSWPA
jgi:hypothetical protein